MQPQSSALLDTPEVPASALMITCGLDRETHKFYESLLDGVGWRLFAAGTLEDLREQLRANCAAVVLCVADHRQGGWRTVLAEVRQLDQPPAFIVLGESSLWNEVLAAGGYDLIVNRLNRYEVLWTIAAAWHEWMNHRDRTPRRDRCSDA
jgi:hypothetical protein